VQLSIYLGAAASLLLTGRPTAEWVAPLVFAALTMGPWALRPVTCKMVRRRQREMYIAMMPPEICAIPRKGAICRVVHSGAHRCSDGGGCVCDIACGCAAAVSVT
jgi:hypothetical protein